MSELRSARSICTLCNEAVKAAAREGTLTEMASPGQVSCAGKAAICGSRLLQQEYSPAQFWSVRSSRSAWAASSHSAEVRGAGEVMPVEKARTPSSLRVALACCAIEVASVIRADDLPEARYETRMASLGAGTCSA